MLTLLLDGTHVGERLGSRTITGSPVCQSRVKAVGLYVLNCAHVSMAVPGVQRTYLSRASPSLAIVLGCSLYP
jgi:hypothetical protein